MKRQIFQPLLSLWLTPIVLIITDPATFITKAQNSNPNTQNFNFDPDSNERQTSQCDIPPVQTNKAFKPDGSMCKAPRKALDLNDAQELAYRYAPVLLFHPLEKYFLGNVSATFEDPSLGKIYKGISPNPPILFDDELNQTSLLRTIRDPNLNMNHNEYFFAHDLKNPPGYVNGANFTDPDGKARKSLARIYYNVIETAENTWTFNYYFYYPFNGKSNLVLLSSLNNTPSYTSFTLSPFGEHEGDWESMSVMVCRSSDASQPLAVTYQQHDWQQTTDCTQGECTFYKDSVHPVGFSALYSHATYPVSTENMIYFELAIPFHVDLQGILVVDRTAYLGDDNTYQVFLPTDENVVRVQNPDEIKLGETPEDLYWQGFGGRWGNSILPWIVSQLEHCFNVNQTQIIDCPISDEAFVAGMQYLGVIPPPDDIIAMGAKMTVEQLLEISSTGIGPTGPIVKTQWSSWMDPTSAILWEELNTNYTSEQYCKLLTEIPDSGRTKIDVETLDVLSQLIGIVVMVIAIVLLTIILFWLYGRRRKAPLEFDSTTGEVKKPSKWLYLHAHVPSIAYTFWFLVMVTGGVMFGVTIDELFDLLEKYVGGIDWAVLKDFLTILGAFCIFVHTILAILIWLPAQAMAVKVMQLYYYFKGDEEEAKKYKEDQCNISYTVLHRLCSLFSGLLLLSLFIALVIVVVGAAVVGFTAAFLEGCKFTLYSLDEICLDLGFWGAEVITCGVEFQDFCSFWSYTNPFVTLWGGVLLLVGHFFLIATSGFSVSGQSDIMNLLDLTKQVGIMAQSETELKKNKESFGENRSEDECHNNNLQDGHTSESSDH